MKRKQPKPRLKIGLCIDGYYFHLISTYYFHEHIEGRHLSIKGLKNFIIAAVSRIMKSEVGSCEIVQSQYFSGRYPLDDNNAYMNKEVEEKYAYENLRKGGVLPNYLSIEDGKEKGIDVLLATTAQDMVIDLGLDVMVLIAGDGDFQTLPKTLAKRGCQTVLLSWDYNSKSRKEDGKVHQTRTSQNLLEEVHHSFKMHQLIEDGLKKEDPLILGLFGRKPKPVPVKEERPKAKKVYPRMVIGEVFSKGVSSGEILYRNKKIKFSQGNPDLGMNFHSIVVGSKVLFSIDRIKQEQRASNLEPFG